LCSAVLNRYSTKHITVFPRSFASKYQTMAPPANTNNAKQKCIRLFALLAAVGASIWCGNTVFKASTNYSSLNTSFDQWINAEAEIVGTNRTKKSLEGSLTAYKQESYESHFTDFYLYCAKVNFITHEGDDITTTIDTRCSKHSSDIPIGDLLEILYNPKEPADVIEVTAYENALKGLAYAIGIAVAFALGFFGCFVFLWIKRLVPYEAHHRTRRTRRTSVALGNVESPEDEIELQKVREELILAHFHFQTIMEDMSNTTATSIRSGELQDIHNKIATADEGEDTSTAANTDTDESVQSPRYSSNISSASTTKPSREDECCICMERYNPGEIICAARTTKCDHVFHKHCVANWLQNHNRCPLCRVDLMQ
jgi:hypothetical protein